MPTLTAIAVLLGPLLATHARAAGDGVGDSGEFGDGDGVELRHLVQTPQSLASFRVAPREMLTSPDMRMLPVEVATAAGLEYVGVDPVEIELVEAVVEPPLGVTPFYAVAIRFASPFDLEDLDPRVRAHCDGATDDDGGVRYESRDPNLPSLAMADGRTLLAASPAMMRKLDGRPPAKTEGPFAAWLDGVDRSRDVHVAIDFEAIRPFAQAGLAMAGEKIPEPARRYLGTIDALRFGEAWIGFTGDVGAGWAVETTGEAAADRVERFLDASQRQWIADVRGALDKLERGHPVADATRSWFDRITPDLLRAGRPDRRGARFSYSLLPGPDDVQAKATALQVAVVGVLAALSLPAVQAAREAARRNASMHQLKQVLLAWHNHHSVSGALPPQAITDAAGRPLLSWRVAMLPYLEEQALFDAFRLDEPWDSPHNLALVPKMPSLYLDPSGVRETAEGKTHYLAVVGPDAAVDGGPEGRPLRAIRDGTSLTLAVVQVDDANAVTWTRPADYDAVAHDAAPLGGIGSLHPSVFLGGFCDGHVQAVPLDTDRETLRGLMTVDGREPVRLP